MNRKFYHDRSFQILIKSPLEVFYVPHLNVSSTVPDIDGPWMSNTFRLYKHDRSKRVVDSASYLFFHYFYTYIFVLIISEYLHRMMHAEKGFYEQSLLSFSGGAGAFCG